MKFCKEFECPYCHHKFSVDLADCSEVTECHERVQGLESCHSIEYIGKCPDCSENIIIKGDAWEYPTGVYDLDDVKIYKE